MAARSFMRLAMLFLCVVVCASGCTALWQSIAKRRPDMTGPRPLNPADIALVDGYQIELVARDFTFPTGVTFDKKGTPYVVEAGYSYGEAWDTPRLLRIEADGRKTPIAAGKKNGPWTGVCYHEGDFYVAEGGQLEGGHILRISADGKMTSLVDELPSMGDHHTNGPVVGPDGWIYFGQGVATNSGIVGTDNYNFGWLKRFPQFHDIPGQDVTLRGENYIAKNPFKRGSGRVATGAFVPFGTPTRPGLIVRGELPCNGAVMRLRPEGGQLELVAWGFRNPFGLAFSPQGELFVTDNMYDQRGSRPIQGAGDLLWKLDPKVKWYGWPDFHAGRPVNAGDLYHGMFEPKPRMLLVQPPEPPPRPVAILGVHSSSDGFDFSRNPRFGYVGQAFIAQFGDQTPATGENYGPVGFKIVRVDIENGIIHDFAVNRGFANGPASMQRSGGLERPVAARFNPDGTALYVVDFGYLIQETKQAEPIKGSGCLWRITRARPAA